MYQLDKLKQTIPQITAAKLKSIIKKEERESFYIVDVREPDEVAVGMIEGAVHIPLNSVPGLAQQRLKERDRPVYLYCASGMRSLVAAQVLKEQGYDHVFSISDGWNGFNTSCDFSDDRYARQLALKEVGPQGQALLKAAKVLIVGVGGIGSPLSMYLSAAGVGTLGIIDGDSVELSNLHRQVIYHSSDVGESKVKIAAQRLGQLNSDVEVKEFNSRLSESNCEKIIQDFDLVVDGSDNFETRYLVNDACCKLNIPFIHASVLRFEGLMAVFDPSQGPCLRCLFPEADKSAVPNCADAGVLGVMPGMMGVLVATEALKLLLGLESDSKGKVISFDGLAMEMRKFSLEKREGCICDC